MQNLNNIATVEELLIYFQEYYHFITGKHVEIETRINNISLEELEIICNKFIPENLDIKKSTLKVKSRIVKFINVKKIFTYIAYYKLECTFEEIGKYLKQDHSTIVNSVQKASRFLDTEKEFKELYLTILKQIYDDYRTNDPNIKITVEPKSTLCISDI